MKLKNVLFLTLLDFESLKNKNMYTDLLREFVRNGHTVYAISPVEKRTGKKTHIVKENNATILRLQIGNIQKTNVIEKGISTVMIESLFIRGIKKYFPKVHFDLVLYTTPPITFTGAVEYIKKRDRAKAYLLLKDIFPQNALDMGMFSKHGLEGIIYRHFRRQEKKLYAISDRIGCMSQANVNYVIRHNAEVNPHKVEICPNSIEVEDKSVDSDTKIEDRAKYGLPLDKKIFVYGGNFGKPQGIDFLIRCIYSQRQNKGAYFLVIGDGTEYAKLERFKKGHQQKNFKLVRWLSREDYDRVIACCDVGMIFLDYRFTIPNFPSRLLGYMGAKLPVIACTDLNTDVGKVVVEGEFGWWCESNNIKNFDGLIKQALKSDLQKMGENAFKYLKMYYDSRMAADIILGVFKQHQAQFDKGNELKI